MNGVVNDQEESRALIKNDSRPCDGLKINYLQIFQRKYYKRFKFSLVDTSNKLNFRKFVSDARGQFFEFPRKK